MTSYPDVEVVDVEGVEVDCPDCGEEALINDDGLYCQSCDG